MVEHLLAGFELFMQWQVLFAVLCGVLTGVIIGALPGLTVVMAITLALPFTFYLPPVVAIAFLMGIYKAGVYGGSISAILIGTPGTPAAAATIIDGYALTKKGQSRKALDVALYASVLADIISDIITVFATFQVAYLALKIGPVEFIAIIIFSLTIIASVSVESILKGLISGGFGLLLATVGMETIYGIDRFTFGNINLSGGLHIIPVLIGLFAMPEIVIQLTKRKNEIQNPTIIKTDETQAEQEGLTFKEFKGVLRTILRGSLIGTIIGVIPGIGGAPAAFINLSRAKKASKHPEEFGKGSLEGVAAAEAGNNGVCGPTLIPLLTLGIPGDKTTAVLLGAFMIQGLTPGPLLFQKHVNIIYGIFIAMIFINLIVLIVGRFGIKWVAMTSRIPKEVLFPIVFVLCVFGAYSVNNNIFDIWAMIMMGIFGYIMLKFGLPQAPFVIAFLLSPMFEDGLRRTLIMSEGDLTIFFSHPIALVFLAMTVVVVIIMGSGKNKKKQPVTMANNRNNGKIN